MALVVASGTVAAGTFTDSIGGTYTKITSALNQASADTIYVFIRDTLIGTGASMTGTFDCTGDAGTGANIFIVGVAGMTKTGATAARQSAITQNTGAGTTPSVTFASACLTGNATIVVIGNATVTAATMTPPTSWTEPAGGDTGHNLPDRGSEYAYRNSGFTGTTVTWGSNSTSAWGAIGVELDTTAATVYNQSVGGGITPGAGVLVNSTKKVLTAGITPGPGTLIKTTLRAFTGAITPGPGTLIKTAQRALAGAITPGPGTLATTKLVVKVVDGAITPAGALIKQALKVLTGANTPVGALIKMLSRALSGTLTPSGALVKTTVKVLVGALTMSGALVNITKKVLTGALTPSGALAAGKQTLKVLTGAITPGTGALATTFNAGTPVGPSGRLTMTDDPTEVRKVT